MEYVLLAAIVVLGFAFKFRKHLSEIWFNIGSGSDQVYVVPVDILICVYGEQTYLLRADVQINTKTKSPERARLADKDHFESFRSLSEGISIIVKATADVFFLKNYGLLPLSLDEYQQVDILSACSKIDAELKKPPREGQISCIVQETMGRELVGFKVIFQIK